MDKANLPPVLVNVSGIRYHVSRDVFSKLPPADKVVVYDSERDGQTTEHFYFKNRTIFETVINHYGGSGLHVPATSCYMEIMDDLSFWGIKHNTLNSCCFINVKRQLNELSIMKDFVEYQTNRVSYDAGEAQGATEIRRMIWNILDFKENTFACRVYFVLSVLMVMTSAVAIAVSTIPKFRQQLRQNITEQKCITYPSYDDSFLTGGISNTTMIPIPPAPTTSESETTTSLPFISNATFNDGKTPDSQNNAPGGKLNARSFHPPPICTDVVKLTNPENPHYFIFFYIELATNVFFFVDLLFRLACCPSVRCFLWDRINIAEIFVMLCAITRYIVESCVSAESGREPFYILFYLQTLRVVRVFRVLKHVRAFQILSFTLSLSVKEIIVLVLYQGAVIVVLSNVIYISEKTMDFPSIPDTWWYTFVSMTTLGYGDMVPKSLIGRIVGSIATVVGLVLFSLVIPIVASKFMTVYNIALSTSDAELQESLNKSKKSRKKLIDSEKESRI